LYKKGKTMSEPALSQKTTARPQLLCPHCKAANLQIRSSIQEHILLKTLFLQCRNVHCGFTGRGNIEITHEISPSAIPDANVNLRTFKELTSRQAANDELLSGEDHD
jgi:hypothetical protein